MDSQSSELRITADAEELCRAAAEEFVSLAREAVKKQGFFAVALSGGSTPRRLYMMLASERFRRRLPWNQIHFFWGDERHVPPDHPDSNYGMAYGAMLSQVPVPPANVHRIKAEYPDAGKAADEYERTLREFSQAAGWASLSFDLVLLGLGVDGHTASLFPGTIALQERERNVVANWIEKFHAYRITLTIAALNNAQRIAFLVSGAEKAEVLRAVLHSGESSELFPVSHIRPAHERLLWLVDSEAAALLPKCTGPEAASADGPSGSERKEK